MLGTFNTPWSIDQATRDYHHMFVQPANATGLKSTPVHRLNTLIVP